MKHTSVLLDTAIDYLNVKPGHWYVDATLGAGGHTRALLKKDAQVLALDWDADAITHAQTTFSQEISTRKLLLAHEGFSQLAEIIATQIASNNMQKPSGVLFDFGTNTEQLTSSSRGFSFSDDGPLDMRMDTRKNVTAADILTVVPEKQLAKLFGELGGEKEGKAIARAIKQNVPTTVSDLVAIITATKKQSTKLHPATKVFQALRIAVNSELVEIEEALAAVPEVIAQHGRVVTIAFHEGEDRGAKLAMKTWEAQQRGSLITKKPVTPSVNEVANNPRSRSAKLRAFAFM